MEEDPLIEWLRYLERENARIRTEAREVWCTMMAYKKVLETISESCGRCAAGVIASEGLK